MNRLEDLILQPNCSDLVVSLKKILENLDEREKLRVLRELEKVTGWKLVVFPTGLGDRHPIEIEDPSKLRIVDNLYYLGYQLKEGLAEVHLVKEQCIHPLTIYSKDWEDIEGPVLSALQHCYTPHFKPLAEVIRYYKVPWWTSGGTPNDFIDWCRKNNYPDVIQLYRRPRRP